MICASYAPGNEGSVLSAAAYGSAAGNRKEVKTGLPFFHLLAVGVKAIVTSALSATA